ncbi:hypothetical protein HMPREF1548_01280 [Clostridium sp. KLE 1755]|nr:hypothetical protein HMPREF1548_01280 [Clostridium sp. KLE 1755]
MYITIYITDYGFDYGRNYIDFEWLFFFSGKIQFYSLPIFIFSSRKNFKSLWHDLFGYIAWYFFKCIFNVVAGVYAVKEGFAWKRFFIFFHFFYYAF